MHIRSLGMTRLMQPAGVRFAGDGETSEGGIRVLAAPGVTPECVEATQNKLKKFPPKALAFLKDWQIQIKPYYPNPKEAAQLKTKTLHGLTLPGSDIEPEKKTITLLQPRYELYGNLVSVPDLLGITTGPLASHLGQALNTSMGPGLLSDQDRFRRAIQADLKNITNPDILASAKDYTDVWRTANVVGALSLILSMGLDFDKKMSFVTQFPLLKEETRAFARETFFN